MTGFSLYGCSWFQCVINLCIVDDKSNGEVNDKANDGVLSIVNLAGTGNHVSLM